jgi:hypothetical protein
MPTMQRIRWTCWYARSTASRSVVPTGFVMIQV